MTDCNGGGAGSRLTPSGPRLGLPTLPGPTTDPNRPTGWERRAKSLLQRDPGFGCPQPGQPTPRPLPAALGETEAPDSPRHPPAAARPCPPYAVDGLPCCLACDPAHQVSPAEGGPPPPTQSPRSTPRQRETRALCGPKPQREPVRRPVAASLCTIQGPLGHLASVSPRWAHPGEEAGCGWASATLLSE